MASTDPSVHAELWGMDPDRKDPLPIDPDTLPPDACTLDHLYQLVLAQEDTEDRLAPAEEDGDAEHARRLAAIRTELLRRMTRRHRSE